MARTPYEVYVDEAGDRGWGGRSSPVFVLSAVVVKRIDDLALRTGLLGINTALARPDGQLLHWAENLREHPDRKFVAGELAELPADFINVVVCKESLIGTGSALSHAGRQYNYAMRRLLERVSWLMDRNYGEATVRLAHVRRFKYETLYDYLDYLAVDRDCRIRWETFKNGTRPKIEQPSQRKGLQVADLVAGCVYAAVRPDRHGGQEPHYLQSIAPRLWTGPTKRLDTYGLHFIAANGHDCGTHYPWLPDLRSTCT